uniref:hypothetical protein n=1 Tax=Lactococcus garvieae TaxID=1363 RepID=UPI0002F6D5D4|nr:hypothetical protein [Lactococcus garvieae]
MPSAKSRKKQLYTLLFNGFTTLQQKPTNYQQNFNKKAKKRKTLTKKRKKGIIVMHLKNRLEKKDAYG